MLGPLAEALDHAAADCERGEHGDLLRRDRSHEGLERVRREGRAEAGQLPRQPREDGIRLRELVERARSNGAPRRVRTTGSSPFASGSTETPPGAGSIRSSLPVHDAVQPAFVPQVGPVDAEGAEALGRDVEVVRLREWEERHDTVLFRLSLRV